MQQRPSDSTAAAEGKSVEYREATEALHRQQGADASHHDNYRMLWQCGFAELIRRDFYSLFEFTPAASGHLLEAGCGTGVEAINMQRLAPGITPHGVDISAVVLAEAAHRPDKGAAVFHQAALERLPFADAVFDIISSHEVVEHLDDPSVVLREFGRVLKPGGICVIATPNGASLWADQLRQRVYRLFGRRGAPVGQDHTRPPSFWRREFARAGLVLDRQIFDGVALEFQTYFAKASWMPWTSRAFEPLRIVPLINLLLCDRVKFRLHKPGKTAGPAHELAACCPLCFSKLASAAGIVTCEREHRFRKNAAGIVDFTAAVIEVVDSGSKPSPEGGIAAADASPIPKLGPIQTQSMDWKRRARRSALFVYGCGYAVMLALLAPLGLLVGLFHQPFNSLRLPARGEQ